MIELMAKLQPEQAAQLGVEGYDDQITDLSPGFVERQLKATREVHAELVRRLAAESDPRVKQDLEILVKAASDMIKGTELTERLEVPDFSLDQLIFQSFRGLLDDQVSASRRPAALVRLRKYAGLEPGTKPITELAIAYIREKLAQPKLVPAGQVEAPEGPGPGHRSSWPASASCSSSSSSMATSRRTRSSRSSSRPGTSSSSPSSCPGARDDFRMPPELYAFSLEQIGIDIPPAELAAKAHQAFTEIQGQMQDVAAAGRPGKGPAVRRLSRRHQGTQERPARRRRRSCRITRPA